MTIKEEIRQYIKSQPIGSRFKARTLWAELFRHGVGRNSVTRALSELESEGIVRKSRVARGRSSEWKVLFVKNRRL